MALNFWLPWLLLIPSAPPSLWKRPVNFHSSANQCFFCAKFHQNSKNKFKNTILSQYSLLWKNKNKIAEFPQNNNNNYYYYYIIIISLCWGGATTTIGVLSSNLPDTALGWGVTWMRFRVPFHPVWKRKFCQISTV